MSSKPTKWLFDIQGGRPMDPPVLYGGGVCIAAQRYRVRTELRLECVRFWRERRKLLVIARSTADPASANCYVRIYVFCQGCSGAGTRGTASPTFSTGGTRPPLPPTFLD